jgi:O-antigen ligase
MGEKRDIPFLQRTVYLFLVLAVIATTLFSWFNVNSWLIILLVFCRLVDGPGPIYRIRTAFSNKFFLAYFAIFLIEALGMLYTHDLYTAYKHVESKATLVAIPFLFCSGEFADRKGYRQLLWGYCLLLAGTCLFCLAVAGYRYGQTGDTEVFFYHLLTEVIESNAVFFSGYVVVALLLLLSPEAAPEEVGGANERTGPPKVGRLRTVLIVFFSGMMVLLASRLLLVWLVIIFLVYLKGRARVRLKAVHILALTALVVMGTGMLALTRNPVEQRYQDMFREDWQYSGKLHFRSHTPFNGVSLRLLIWRFAGEILDEHHAWLIGVSAGDSQALLDEKYLAANMPYANRGYNFHNQYLEVLVRSGIPGLCIFLLALGMLVELARRTGTMEAWFVLLTMLLLAMTESTLEMQQSLFAFCFFPLMLSAAAPRGLCGK